MTKTIAVLKWLWSFPLRDALIFGVASYFYLRQSIDEVWYCLLWAVLMGIVGYFWQLLKERTK